MRIIEVCTSESLGGLELYFASCCSHLKDRDHSVIAVVHDQSPLQKRLQKEVPCHTLPASFFKGLNSLLQLIKSFEPDIIHVHHKKDLLMTSLVKQISSMPFKYVHTRQMDLPRNKKNSYHSFIYQSMDLIIAITDRLRDQILSKINIDANKVVRLYYGVPKIPANQDKCSKIGIDGTFFNVGVIARIDRKKEQEVIIEAISDLRENNRKVRVCLVGGSTDDEYQQKLEETVKEKQLENEVIFLGFIEGPQQVMPCFDVIVLTTGNETFGLVLPEAMRMEVPVIGANGGGVPEIIDEGKTGLMFTPGNAKELSEKIQRMMDPDYAKELAMNGKRKADQLFEIEKHFDKLVSLFEA